MVAIIKNSITLGSDEWFEKYYPKNKAATSRRLTRTLISNLESATSISVFLGEAFNTNRFATRLAFVKKLSGIYIASLSDKEIMLYNEKYNDYRFNQQMGITQIKANENLDEQFETIRAVLRRVRNIDITKEFLFGAWLPPRRQDVYRLYIVVEYKPGVNQYNKLTQQFSFHDKSNKTKVDQNIPILSLMPLYKNKPEMLKQIINFLNSQPEGKLFNYGQIDYHIKKNWGVSNSTLRKYWESVAVNHFDPEQRKILATWMDHKPASIMQHYIKKID